MHIIVDVFQGAGKYVGFPWVLPTWIEWTIISYVVQKTTISNGSWNMICDLLTEPIIIRPKYCHSGLEATVITSEVDRFALTQDLQLQIRIMLL